MKMRNRYEVEYIRDMIKSDYHIESDYDDYEQRIMLDYEFYYIDKEEFIQKLKEHYQDLIELEEEE